MLKALSVGLLLVNSLMIATKYNPAVASTEERIEAFIGTARSTNGEIAYIEQHRLIFEDGRQWQNDTRYLSAAGFEFAVLTSNFTSHPYVPTYHFEDKRFGREDGTKVQGQYVKVYGKKSASDEEQATWIELSNNSIAGQGLHFFIRDHLEELSRKGASKKIQFLIPLEGDQYSFRIRRVQKSDEQPGIVTLVIEIDNWLIRLVAPRIEVQYERATKRLLSYKGASHLLDGNQNVQDVVINYEYRE